jgi:hypothetical protein
VNRLCGSGFQSIINGAQVRTCLIDYVTADLDIIHAGIMNDTNICSVGSSYQLLNVFSISTVNHFHCLSIDDYVVCINVSTLGKNESMHTALVTTSILNYFRTHLSK